MSRIKSRPRAIVVVDLSDHQPDELDERWLAAGRKLRKVNPAEYERMRALVDAFVSVEERELESGDAFAFRLAAIGGAS